MTKKESGIARLTFEIAHVGAQVEIVLLLVLAIELHVVRKVEVFGFRHALVETLSIVRLRSCVSLLVLVLSFLRSLLLPIASELCAIFGRRLILLVVLGRRLLALLALGLGSVGVVVLGRHLGLAGRLGRLLVDLLVRSLLGRLVAPELLVDGRRVERVDVGDLLLRVRLRLGVAVVVAVLLLVLLPISAILHLSLEVLAHLDGIIVSLLLLGVLLLLLLDVVLQTLDLGLLLDVLADVRRSLAVSHAGAVGRLAVRASLVALAVVFRGSAEAVDGELLYDRGQDVGELERRLVPFEERRDVAADLVCEEAEEGRHSSQESRDDRGRAGSRGEAVGVGREGVNLLQHLGEAEDGERSLQRAACALDRQVQKLVVVDVDGDVLVRELLGND